MHDTQPPYLTCIYIKCKNESRHHLLSYFLYPLGLSIGFFYNLNIASLSVQRGAVPKALLD